MGERAFGEMFKGYSKKIAKAHLADWDDRQAGSFNPGSYWLCLSVGSDRNPIAFPAIFHSFARLLHCKSAAAHNYCKRIATLNHHCVRSRISASKRCLPGYVRGRPSGNKNPPRRCARNRLHAFNFNSCLPCTVPAGLQRLCARGEL